MGYNAKNFRGGLIMRTIKIAVPVCIVLLSAVTYAAPPAKAPTAAAKTAPSQLQISYAKRVDTISDELKASFADLWLIFGKMEDSNTLMQKHARRDGDASGADKEEWNKLKTSLSASVQSLRGNTKRLRGISPVPRSLKKIDNEMVDASFEIEIGLDSLMSWVGTPSPEMNLQLGRQLRKGTTSWSNALVNLGRATDSAVKAKVYVED